LPSSPIESLGLRVISPAEYSRIASASAPGISLLHRTGGQFHYHPTKNPRHIPTKTNGRNVHDNKHSSLISPGKASSLA
jgi:hypothetical protein